MNPFFEVRKSKIQGRGAFATAPIKKNQRIIEYTGEHISNAEADSRYDESKMRRHHTFLFTLTSRTVVDGAVGGNEAIYINHSCDPNCEAVIEGRKIYIHALRAIVPGDELVYDYQYERTGDEEEDAEMEDFYKCLCGSKNCRGSIMKPAEKKRVRKNAASKTKAKAKAKSKTKSKAVKKTKTTTQKKTKKPTR